jgi:hypothetical protein
MFDVIKIGHGGNRCMQKKDALLQGYKLLHHPTRKSGKWLIEGELKTLYVRIDRWIECKMSFKEIEEDIVAVGAKL